jgi:hypothetical protein
MVAAASMAMPGAAMAADGLAYDPSGGSEFFQNLAGVGYIILVAVFLFRVLTRRAKRAREQVSIVVSRSECFTRRTPLTMPHLPLNCAENSRHWVSWEPGAAASVYF